MDVIIYSYLERDAPVSTLWLLELYYVKHKSTPAICTTIDIGFNNK